MNIDAINSLLKKLNDELKKEGQSRELVICGGAAMLLSEFVADDNIKYPPTTTIILRFREVEVLNR